MNKIIVTMLLTSFAFSGDADDVRKLIDKHYKAINSGDMKTYASTMHSKGNISGDSNGSFWYTQNPSVIAQNDPLDFNMTAHYIDVEVLSPGKVAIAYFYLTGSYNIDGVQSNNYRTRVSKVLVKEGKQWKIRLSHYTPFFSGAGIPD